MAYSELVKNFNKIREYMREFFVYGFKSRDEFTAKSARSYDDERRRMESWLGDYMRFSQTPDGKKNVFISIDSRLTRHNPLYKAWKTKSFTDGDITLHFILFDILNSPDVSLSLNEIMLGIDDYLFGFDEPKVFDQSTVRKKLKEYISEGLIETKKQGKTVLYSRAADTEIPNGDAVNFFSEVAPCGVIGSFLLDKSGDTNDCFAFKHHYITSAMDSEVVCSLFFAMSEKRHVTLNVINRKKERTTQNKVVPLRIMISVQDGRQYLLAYQSDINKIAAYRTDNILSVIIDEVCDNFDELRKIAKEMSAHMWGVTTGGIEVKKTDHVEFTVRYNSDEEHIHRRLLREKRCGTVERIDENTSKFSADLFSAKEIIPWMRTFICRITDYSFSNPNLQRQFGNDIEKMYMMYGIGEECE